MIDEHEFAAHLQTITPENWNRLFQLLPEIDAAANFDAAHRANNLEQGSIDRSTWSSSKIVDDFFEIFHHMKLCVVFDWMNWTEGKMIVDQKDFDFNKLDTVLPLAAGGDLEALNCQHALKLNRSTNLQLTTSPPLAASGCCV